MKESGLEGYEYFAFISYSSKDAKFANKLQRHLERYRLPVLLSRQYPRTPRRLRPICREEEETHRETVSKAKFLIVICTETSAQEDVNGYRHVDAEVEAFVAANPDVNRARVIPVIYREKGGARATECIPPAVKALDLLALDVLDKGYAQVCNQIVSRMVGIKPGILWNRWQRKARKNMALASAVAFPVLVAALVTIGGSLWQSLLAASITVGLGVLCRRLYTTPRIVNYERWMEANNLPVGIRQLTDAEVACRAQHYRFTYRGFRLVKVECCNSSGVPVVQQRAGFAHPEVSTVELFYNEKGKVNRQVWSDEHGVVLREVHYEQQDGQDWVNFRSAGGDFAENHRLISVEGQNSAVTRYRVQRNEQGQITEVSYRNTAGAPCPDADGSWGRRYELDTARGLVTAQYSLNPKGEPENNRYGIAVQRFEYDDAGHLCASSYHNQEGVMLYNEDLVATRLYETDAHGNCTKISYLGPDGKAALCRELMAEKHLRYDERGFVTEEVYYGSEGLLQLNRRGYARCVYTRNAAGTITEVSYFDENGQPCLCCELYHHEVRTVDEFGNSITTTYFDEAGKPCLNRDWAHRIASAYDADGQLSSQRYYDAQDSPTLCRHGYHMVKYVYDTHGNIGMETYYGTDEQPCRNRHGIACTMREFDTQHNCLKEAYYDENGTACVHAETLVASTEMEYDAGLNKTKERYFGVNGQICAHRNGYAGIEWQYNEFGHPISEVYKSIHDEPIEEENKPSEIKCQYDTLGNIIAKQHVYYFDPMGMFFDAKKEEYTYNESGLLTAHRLIQNEITEDELTLYPTTVAKSDFCTHYEYDKRGNIIRAFVKANNDNSIRNNEEITEIRYEYDTHDRKIAESYFDINGNPIKGINGACKIKTDYDKRGNKICFAYYAEDGNLCLTPQGHALAHISYNQTRQITGIRYEGTNGKEISPNGYSCITHFYDERSNLIRCEYSGADGQPRISNISGIAAFTCHYNEKNQKIKECYYGVDGTPSPNLLNNAGIIKTEYDTYGRECGLSLYTPQEQPATCAYGYTRKEIYYREDKSLSHAHFYTADNRLRIHVDYIQDSSVRKEETGFCMQEQPINEYQITSIKLWDTQYTTIISYHNDEELLIRLDYCDTDGQLISPCHRYASFTIEYDENLNITDLSFFDKYGNRCLHESYAYAQMKRLHNDEGKLIREDFYDEKGILVKNVWVGYASKRIDYDKNGNIHEITYLDEHGKQHLNPHSDFARTILTYDDNNHLIAEEYLDADDKLVLNTKKGYAYKKLTYDDKGRLSEVGFYDSVGKLHLNPDKAYAHKRIFYEIVDSGRKEQHLYYNGKEECVKEKLIQYDELDRIIQINIKRYSLPEDTDDTEDSRVIYLYDTHGNKTDIELYNKEYRYARISNTYDNNHNLIRKEHLDGNDNLIYHPIPLSRPCYEEVEESAQPLESRTCYEYDTFNRLTCITYYDVDGTLRQRIYHEYDEHGRITARKYEMGKHMVDKQYQPEGDNELTSQFVGYGLHRYRGISAINYRYITTKQGKELCYKTYLRSSLDGEFAPNTIKTETKAPAPNVEKPSETLSDYFAFISYSSKDVKFADKLQRHLEAFRLPATIAYQHQRAPKRLQPIFRDRTDLEQGNLSEMLMRGLRASKYLLVICSENSAQPNRFGKRYVDMEVNSFIALNPAVNKSRVIPIIYRESENTPIQDCIPPAIKEHGLTPIDMGTMGMASTFNSVIARMTGLNETVLQNHKKRIITKYITLSAILTFLVVTGLILGGSYASVVASLCSIILLVYAIITFQMYYGKHTERYAHYIQEYNLLIGIGKLSKEEAKQRAYHYRFTFRGYKIRRVECCNAAGALTECYPEAPMLMNAARIEVLYNEYDNVIRHLYSDTKGFITRQVQFELNELNDWMDFYSPSGNTPIQHRNRQDGQISPVQRYQIIRNEYGLISEIRYSRIDGIPCPDSDGTWGQRYEYHKNKALVTKIHYLNEAGENTLNNIGIAGYRFEYNEQNSLIASTSINLQGEPTADHVGVAGEKYKYNSIGNIIEISYHDAADKLILNQELIAIKRFEYSEKGYLISETYYDEQGKLGLHKDGYTYCKYERNSAGESVSISYYYQNAAPCDNKYGYHKKCITFDKGDNKLQTTYFASNGSPCITEEGIHQQVISYDESGKVRTIHYNDEQGNPCFHRNHYHSICYSYNEQGNVSEECYYAPNGTPCSNNDGIHCITRQFDSMGNCTEEAYFNSRKEPSYHAKSRISMRQMEYSPDCRKVKEEYYNAKQKRVMNNHNHAMLEWLYDEKGRCCEIKSYHLSWEREIYTIKYKVEHFERDEKGRTISAKSWIHCIDNDGYDEDLSTQHYHYNEIGLLRKYEYLSAGSKSHVIYYQYDQRRNIVEQRHESYSDIGLNEKEDDIFDFADEELVDADFVDADEELLDTDFEDADEELLDADFEDEDEELLDADFEDEDEELLDADFEDEDEEFLDADFEDADEELLDADFEDEDEELLDADFEEIDEELKEDSPKDNDLESYLKLTFNDELVMIYRWDYDLLGKCKSEQYIGMDGSFCDNLWGHTEVKYKKTGNQKTELQIYGESHTLLCCIRYKVNHFGKIVEAQYMAASPANEETSPNIHCFRCLYDDCGNKIKEEYYTQDGIPCRHKKSGAAAVKWEYDAEGNEILMVLLDENGEPINGTNGYSHILTEYDTCGYIDKKIYLNTEEQIVQYTCQCYYSDVEGVGRQEINTDITPDRYCFRQFFGYKDYNEIIMGYTYRLISLNPDGTICKESKYINGGQLESYVLYNYNNNHKRIKESCFNKYDKACHYGATLIDSYASIEYAYNECGQLTHQTYLDTKGRPTKGHEGYARMHKQYDDNGRLLKTEYYDKTGKLRKNDIAKEVYQYHQNGNIAEIRYLDCNGKLKNIKDGRCHARVEFKYNSCHYLIQESYYNALNQKGKKSRNSYSEKFVEYTENGEIACIKLYDKDGNPFQARACALFATTEFHYAENLIREDYYNHNHDLIYSKVSTKDSKHGKITTEEFQSPKGDEVISLYHTYTRKITTYDDRGNIQMIEYRDDQNNPCSYTEYTNENQKSARTYSRIMYKYDAEDRLIHVAFYGEDGKPCVLGDDEGRCYTAISYNNMTNEYGQAIKETKYYYNLGISKNSTNGNL